MDIKKQKIKELQRDIKPNNNYYGGRSNFQNMLEKHLKQVRTGEHPTEQQNTKQNQLDNRSLNFDQDNSIEVEDILSNLDKLQALDSEYFKKAQKKSTLGQNFAKNFGTDSWKRLEKFKPLIEMKAKKYGLDPNLLASLIKQESNFNPYAVSHCGAMGLGQLMPETARHLGVVDPFNAAQNIDGAAKYLKEQLDTFGGNVSKALAAYNAGPGAVKKYRGIPPYRETQNYVRSIKSHYAKISKMDVFKPQGKPA